MRRGLHDAPGVENSKAVRNGNRPKSKSESAPMSFGTGRNRREEEFGTRSETCRKGPNILNQRSRPNKFVAARFPKARYRTESPPPILEAFLSVPEGVLACRNRYADQ